MTPLIAPRPHDAATWEQWRDWIVLNLSRKVLTADECRHVSYLYSAKWPSSPEELQEAEAYRHACAQLVHDAVQAKRDGQR